mmetsp:Transcript_2048/g.4464  ORF Transcript_2048/g.4464 Transcript_2048/m.4464 type:complete len:106 (+) Transcript_2048:613-930(+)
MSSTCRDDEGRSDLFRARAMGKRAPRKALTSRCRSVPHHLSAPARLQLAPGLFLGSRSKGKDWGCDNRKPSVPLGGITRRVELGLDQGPALVFIRNGYWLGMEIL